MLWELEAEPSQLYHHHRVILEGAREHGLPAHYRESLARVLHNGDNKGDGSVNITFGRF